MCSADLTNGSRFEGAGRCRAPNMAALAEGHHSAVEHIKERQATLFVAPLTTEPAAPVPTGLALGARF